LRRDLPRAGLYAGQALSYSFESDRVIRVFKRVAQGLYYDKTQQHFSDTGVFESGRVSRVRIEDHMTFLKGAAMDDPVSLENGVCDFMRGGFEMATHVAGRFFLMFYNKSVAVDIRVLVTK